MKTLHFPALNRSMASLLVAGAALAHAPEAFAQPIDFLHHGHFRRMMHTGDTGGRIELSALPGGPGRWGVGVTAGLTAEVVQIDGRLLVSPGSDPRGRLRAPLVGEQATLFAGARIDRWVDVGVPDAMDQGTFERFVREQAAAAGLSLDQPFVFRVEGRFPELLWHVVTGEAAEAKPDRHGHGSRPHGAAHANARADMRRFDQPGTAGQMIGIYSGETLEGIVSHPGERFHVHFADRDVTVSGHVDRYSVAAGAVLRLGLR